MKCPHCSAKMDRYRHSAGRSTWNCWACGLAGPVDVLESLAARLAPAGVMAEAQRLLAEAGVSWPELCELADAYSALVKETP